MIIPGFLIAWLTFPGVIVHEAAHMLFCRFYGIYIHDVKFFRFATKGPAGYVIHEPTDNFTANFFITVGPFLLNTALCLLFCLPALLPIHYFETDDPFAIFFGWLGISIGMHAFPSTQDARNLWAAAQKQLKSGKYWTLPFFPLVVIIYVGNILSIFWFDALYAAGVGFFLPEYLFKAVFRTVI